ncbi:C4-dicarboxylate ABC transporter substrate-binding protein [Mycolicibacterium wolinskyi]|uniref:C4-dicarboxylate ABC transporter substrate-binding protein n=1 Tax=Mycolicibacterium wolinskyi TaxID=59750 RepID=A0A132PND7_9MYCO|nr:TAXI family TRAP transporter solute-binding subunit [Mycolicibacterium wolinskyi]KWX23858.1 C4-dicarboxylate ABC transporter substrate-binding protein [Mycolicibacterium wolinskyi]
MGNNASASFTTPTAAKLGVALGAMVLVLAGCGGQRSADNGAAASEPTSCEVTTDARLSIATGNTTGVYYTLGGAYAEAISQQTDGKLKATAAETSASLQNIQQLVAGTHQIAFSLADTAADAVNGTASFTEKQPIAALTRLYPNYTQVIARTDAGINTIADMRGKRVSTGAPNSGTEVIANRMLEAAGLNPAGDVAAQRTELGKTVEGMKDGSIDAMFWSGGLPTSGITDLFVSRRDQVKFIDVTDTLPKLQEINSIYEQGVIPASTYQTPADVPTVVVPNLLLVKDDMDGNTACVLTKALFEHKDDLVKANKAADNIALDTARETSPVPLHPGAQKALDELGATN